MTPNFLQSINFDFKKVLIEEISLEGLEGIELDLLWRRMSKRISSPITEKMKVRYWNIILNTESISMYQIPEPLPHLDIQDRFTIIDEATGDLKDPEDYLDGPYEYRPIDNVYGSCKYYDTRILLDKAIVSKLNYEGVLSTYGNKLVLVASLEERWFALAPHIPITFVTQLTNIHYCILELIGKARENGQMTIGKTNLTKIIKDPKLLFYNRKVLQDLDLVKTTYITQVTDQRGLKGILLRLKRYHKSSIHTIPKAGCIFNLVEYLKQQPNYCERTEIVLRKGLLTQTQNKRFHKMFYIFGFDESPEKFTSAKKRTKENKKRRYIYLFTNSDESNDSEDEEEVTSQKCQYKVGVHLMRQAYEKFLEAGLHGLTQIELGELVGIEFYMSRSICRFFKSKHLVREFLEDHGRQRTARFVAVAATEKMDAAYAEQIKKFNETLTNISNMKTTDENTNDSDSDSEVPLKKIKLEDKQTPKTTITEIKVPDSIKHLDNIFTEKSQKKLTLRQLKYANGILKVIQEKNIVIGYQTLNRLVAAETKEMPMDLKALRVFLHKLVDGGYMKIFVINWPGFKNKHTTIICAPHITEKTPEVRAKYVETIKRAKRNKENKLKQKSFKSLTQYAYPRFVKLQKIHEAIVNYAYVDKIKTYDHLPQGFIYIKDLIQELTVEVALGNTSSAGSIDLAKFTIPDDLFHLKLREAPLHVAKILTNSSNLYNSVRSVVKSLALLGVVQLIAQNDPSSSSVPDNSLAIHLFYVNKKGSIVDTSGVWPKQTMPSLVEKKFTFNTAEDVKDFWNAIYIISNNTTIEVPNRRQKKIPQAPIRPQCDVQINDDGSRIYKKAEKKLKHIVEETATARQPMVKLTANVVQTKQTNIDNEKKSKASRQKKSDYIPLTWSEEEDRVIMMCKAAINIMSPIPQPGSLQIRNLVMKDILSMKDPKKNQKACHRRAGIIDTISTMVYEKDCLLAELRQHSNILRKYEGMLKKLRILHSTNMSKYVQSAHLPLLELVFIIMKLLKNICVNIEIPNFENIEDFRSKYNIAPSASKRICSTYKSAPDDIVYGPLKESIVLTVMLSYKREVLKEDAKNIFFNFDRYDEKTLREAVDQLRKCGAVAAKEKVFNGLIPKVNLDDVVHCWYKIAVHYQRKWSCRLNSQFATDVASTFAKSFDEHNLKGLPEINCFSFELEAKNILDITPFTAPSITGFSGSIIQEDNLNAIDIENKYKLKSGTWSWKVKANIETFADLYKAIDVEGPINSHLSYSFISRDQQGKQDNFSEDEQKIMGILTNKCVKGATFSEMLVKTGFDRRRLIEVIKKLEDEYAIKRVGTFDNIFVLFEYVENWSMVVQNDYILAKPWLTVDRKLRAEIFMEWAGVIMNKVFEHSGCSFLYLSDTCELLTTVAVQDVCQILQAWGCVTLRSLVASEPGLFSDSEFDLPTIIDYNMYDSPQNQLVFCQPDSLVRYSFIRKIVYDIFQQKDMES
ncbi:hypothetical protein ACJJTC_006897 [Scirpophaga incertulas]